MLMELQLLSIGCFSAILRAVRSAVTKDQRALRQSVGVPPPLILSIRSSICAERGGVTRHRRSQYTTS